MFYDFYGNPLETAYNFEGEPIEIRHDQITLTDVVSYYRTPVENLVNTLNASDNLNFVILTDTHGTANKQHSQNVARYILENSNTDRLFWLGDVPYDAWSMEQFETFYEPLKNCNEKLYLTCGNHDTHAYAGGTVRQDLPVIYHDILADKMWISGNPQKFYYYLDDYKHKVRMIVLNTGEDSTTGNAVYISSEQINWLKSVVILPSSEWSVVVLSHVGIADEQWNLTGTMRTNVINAIKQTNGTVIGYFCGHIHIDKISDANGIKSVTLLNDSCMRDSLTDYNFPRQAGTESEQAISVISVDIPNRKVYIYRIGAGNDMEYTY